MDAGFKVTLGAKIRHCPECGGCLKDASLCVRLEAWGEIGYWRKGIRAEFGKGKGRFTQSRFGAGFSASAEVCYNACSGDLTLSGGFSGGAYGEFGWAKFTRSINQTWSFETGKCKLARIGSGLLSGSGICCKQEELPECL